MIDTIKDEELRIKQEDLLKNMKMLRHTVLDMFGSKSFFKGLIPEPHNGVITVNGEQFPVYISGNTLNIDSHPDITDDIFDTENYLSLLTDDDLMWYALVEHLAHQIELLQEDNNKYNDDLVKANEEIDNLNCKVAEEIKARRGYEESLNQLREELTAADNEIEGLEESLREANQACTEYVHRIDEFENENKRLSERVKTLVIEKTNRPDTAEKASDPKEDIEILNLLTRITELENENEKLKKKLFCSVPTKFGEQERGTPEDKAVRMDLEAALMQQQISQLNIRIAQLEEKLKDKDGRIDQLSKNNAALSTENKNFGDLLKEADRTARFYAREVDNLEKEINDLKSEANDEDSDSVPEPHIVTANDDMKYTVSLETMNELTARIKELESINENLREENESLRKKLDVEISMINSVNSRNEELKTENDELRKDNEDFTSIAEAHLETTAKFAEYKDRQKRLYKHFKNLAEMIEDLMELG